jgi:hypothetical protein
MKRFTAFFFFFLTAALVLAGCGSTGKYGANAPGWAGERPPQGTIWGVGTAAGGIDAASIMQAQNRGRISIARQLDGIARETLLGFKGAGKTRAGRAALAGQTGRRLISMELRGTNPVLSWRAPDGRWWSRIAMDNENAEPAIMEAVDALTAELAGFDRAAFQKLLVRRLARGTKSPLVVDN